MASEIHRGDPPTVTPPVDSMAVWVRDVAADRDATAALVREGDEFVDRSWGETVDRARSVAAGLVEAGAEPGDRVAIRADTCYEWSVVDLACHLAGLVLVPVYPSFSPGQARHVVEDAGATLLVSEDPAPEPVADAVEEVFLLEDLPAVGKDRSTGEVPEGSPESDGADTGTEGLPGTDRGGDDVATIVYTSGTTGDPKGVALTHHNLLSTLSILSEHIPEFGARASAFLPLSHVYQRLGNYHAWHRGAAVAYMDPDDLAEELRMVRPTAVMAVPRLYERIHDRIESRAADADGAKGRLLRWALGVAREYGAAIADGGAPSRTLATRHALAERLVYPSLRERIGLDELEFSVTGAASIDPDVLEFFWGIGVRVMEGYGATELTTPGALTPHDRFRPGTVGPPAPGVAMRIAEDGEILVQGPNVMEGYWNDETATDAAMADGWFHTGDLGRFDDAGYLAVEGRKKEVAVLDTGRNVAPTTVEDALTRHRLVAEAMAVADGRKFVTALIQPDLDALLELAREEEADVHESGVEREDDEVVAVPRDLVEDERIRERYRAVVADANADLADYQEVGRFRLVERAFTVDREELTPTLKKRRETIADHYRDRIESMYAGA